MCDGGTQSHGMGEGKDTMKCDMKFVWFDTHEENVRWRDSFVGVPACNVASLIDRVHDDLGMSVLLGDLRNEWYWLLRHHELSSQYCELHGLALMLRKSNASMAFAQPEVAKRQFMGCLAYSID